MFFFSICLTHSLAHFVQLNPISSTRTCDLKQWSSWTLTIVRMANHHDWPNVWTSNVPTRYQQHTHTNTETGNRFVSKNDIMHTQLVYESTSMSVSTNTRTNTLAFNGTIGNLLANVCQSWALIALWFCTICTPLYAQLNLLMRNVPFKLCRWFPKWYCLKVNWYHRIGCWRDCDTIIIEERVENLRHKTTTIFVCTHP